MKFKALSVLATGALLSVGLAACGTEEGSGGVDSSGEPEALVLALVPSNEADVVAESADEIAEVLTEKLGVEVTGTIQQDYTALTTAMSTGQAQIGMTGASGMVQAIDQADAVPILQSVRFGAPTYHGQWMTNNPDKYCLDDVVEADDGLKYCNGTLPPDDGSYFEGPAGDEAIELVDGESTIAYVDTGSGSGYQVPLIQWGEVTGGDPLNDLSLLEAGDHDNTPVAVAKGDAEIGFSFWDARDDENQEIVDNVVVFAYTPEITNDGVVVSGDLSEDWQQKIADAMMEAIAEEQPEGDAEPDGPFYLAYEIEELVPADVSAIDNQRKIIETFGE